MRCRQTAQSTRHRFQVIQAASINKATLVFVFAASDVPKWKINVVPEVMNTSQFSRQVALLSGALRLIQQMQRFVALGMFTGLRKGDLLKLTKTAIRHGQIWRRTNKTGQEVSIPIHPRPGATAGGRTGP